MFDPQPKPEFHNYPLRVSELTKLNQEMVKIDQEIYQNRNQIQQIRKKFQNQQHQNAYINRLHQKTKILQLKKQQLQYVNKMHQFHQLTQNKQKKIDFKMRSNLANQYKQQIEQNKRKKSVEKEMETMRDREMLEKVEVMGERQSRRRQFDRSNVEYGNVLENMIMQEKHYVNQQKQRQLQKQSYTQSITHPQQGEKDSAFKQYYKQTQQNQQRLSQIYNTSTAQQNTKKSHHLNQLQLKNQLQYIKSMQKQAIEQNERKTQNKQQLKVYLEKQIEQKALKKQHDREKQIVEDMNRLKGGISNERYQAYNKQQAKKQQLLYSTELSKQYNEQVQLQKVNSHRGRQHSYMNQSTQALITKQQLHSPHSPKTGIFLGHQKGRSSLHNPITNPIPFSIGMSNPYVLKQYQNKRVSSNSLWGSNLAKLGDQTIRN